MARSTIKYSMHLRVTFFLFFAMILEYNWKRNNTYKKQKRKIELNRLYVNICKRECIILYSDQVYMHFMSFNALRHIIS